MIASGFRGRYLLQCIRLCGFRCQVHGTSEMERACESLTVLMIDMVSDNKSASRRGGGATMAGGVV